MGHRIIMMKQPFNKLLAVFTIAALAQGCSSMNQSECIHADWQLIGQADASKGVHSSILDEYRHDCAEYAVVPAREAYHFGYQEGLKQFCTRSSGFFQGKKGSKYQGICPAALEEQFLQGYNPGYELFMISDAVTTLRATLSDAERDIRKLRKRIGKKEQLLISDKSTPADRKRLLGEIKAHHREIFWLQQDAEDSRFELLRRQSEYDRKVRLHTY